MIIAVTQITRITAANTMLSSHTHTHARTHARTHTRTVM